MSILVDNDTKLCVSGITGREGTFHTLNNQRYGTHVVAGVTPGTGGQDVDGVPVVNTFHEAVEVILSNPNVKAVLFNIIGGITRCDEVAKGLIEAFNQINPQVPFVVRLDGTNDVEGRQLLADANLPNVHTESTMLGAAKKVVELAS